MGRPSKLDDRQKAEIGRRLAAGESGRKLAKEFRVSEGTIRANITTHPSEIRNIATRLAKAELDLNGLPISAQGSVRSLADQLKGMQSDYMAGASTGLKTATLLQTLAHKKAGELDPETVQTEDLRLVAALTDTANKSAAMGTTLLTANKDKADSGKKTLEDYLEEARVRPA